MLALFSLPLWSVIKLGMDVSYFVIPTILLLVIDLIINFKKVQILILFVLLFIFSLSNSIFLVSYSTLGVYGVSKFSTIQFCII